MVHNVTIAKSENKMLEQYWVMVAMKNEIIAEHNQRTGLSKVSGTEKCVVDKKELDHEPTPSEIAQFLSDSKADFVSVGSNYRFEPDLPFC